MSIGSTMALLKNDVEIREALLLRTIKISIR